MLFAFHLAPRALRQPYKHSHSLQLATHTELVHHYLHYLQYVYHLFPPFSFFKVLKDFFKVLHSHLKASNGTLERAVNHIKVTRPPCSGCRHGKM